MTNHESEAVNSVIGQEDSVPENARGAAPAGMHRFCAISVSVATLTLLLLPIRQNWSQQPIDDFPLSFYPMFTPKRGETTVIYHAVGLTSDGSSVHIPGRFAAPGGMNTVRVQMRRMCLDGRAAELAEHVATKLDGSPFAEHYDIRRVAVVRSEYAIFPYFHGRKEPASREVGASIDLDTRSAP